jgi:hypothetical protein
MKRLEWLKKIFLNKDCSYTSARGLACRPRDLIKTKLFMFFFSGAYYCGKVLNVFTLLVSTRFF